MKTATHIVFLVSTLRRTGPTAQLLNIVRHLDREKFTAQVVTISPEPADSMHGSFIDVGVPVKSFGLSRLRAAMPRNWRCELEQLLGVALGRGAVVHTQGLRADVIASTALAGIPRIATARNYPAEDYLPKFGPIVGRWMVRKHLAAFRALPVVAACSQTLAERLRNHGVHAMVVRNGVDMERFKPPDPAERLALRAEMGFSPDVKIGIMVGALAARKNPLAVIRAVRSLPDARLALAVLGSGDLESPCQAAAGDDHRIHFFGQVSDVSRYLRMGDFLVSASHSEGLPNAVLEAMACGLPVVLSDIGPHRELAKLVPLAGHTFPLDDERALVEAIRKAMDIRLETQQLQAIEKSVSARQMSQRYQTLYQQTLCFPS